MCRKTIRTLTILSLVASLSMGLFVTSVWAVADPISDGSWTMVLLPDTQNYCDTDAEAAIFNAQTQWIADHQSSHNIQMVLHQGDVTNHNYAAEFARGKAAMSILENAGIPYSVAPGNHDYDLSTRTSLFNNSAYFGPGSAYANQSIFTGTNGGFFEAGKTDNSYCTFNAGGQDWLVFSAEFGPRDEVLAWMDSVAAAHEGYNFIFNTHAYLYSDSTRYDWATYGSSQSWNPHNYSALVSSGTSINDGQEIWDSLIKKYPTWKFTFNGHVLNDGTGWLSSEGDNGNIVHQMLANYQMRSEGGEGYLRILEFTNDGETVKVSSYSPYLDSYLTSADQSFTFNMNQHVPAPPRIHGTTAMNLTVNDSDNVWTITGSGPGAGSLLSPANRADVSVAIDGLATQRDQGVMMATVSQNSRNGYYGTVEVSHINYFDLEDTVLQIATSRAYNGGEYNMNVATGFFPFADGWIGGHVDADGTVLENYSISSDDVSHMNTGLYRVTVDGINSQEDGILFAVGAANGYNFVSTAPVSSGAGWYVTVRDNTATTFSALEDNRWSFVYLDYDAPGMIGGRVSADGTVVNSAGDFSMTRISTGVYRLTVDGYTPDDGSLMLSIAELETDGVTRPDDNIITYEDDGNGGFLVNVRDRNGTATVLEDGAFVFAFLPFDGQLAPAVPGDANYDGVVDMEDANILLANMGSQNALWMMGDFDLNGTVNDNDVTILIDNWDGPGDHPFVPEPSSLVLLGGVGLWLIGLRRRKK